jgi:hypothetical protein
MTLITDINIGLLGAVAIIASLTGVFLETKFENRWTAYTTILFGISGVLSTIVLFDNVRAIIYDYQINQNILVNLTYGSIFSFLAGTEILLLTTFNKFWKKGKVAKRR